jgi:HD-like signal output (HDOD) protein
MKKQICFAGFGEKEVAGLQPSLTTLGVDWDCEFSPDATAALAALAQTPFDAVVANLSSGGIHDSEFLRQAAIGHARTLRFVLGDVGDRELIVNGLGGAHQFISRPWRPQELISIIERSLALDAWLSNDKLRSFVPRLGKLPGLPATYFEVLKKAESPNSSVESIAEVISRDPSLTARLLQMVNSPACGLAEKITGPAEAVSMLGLETVKSLVLCLQLFAQAARLDGSLSLEQLWQHSFRVAKLAAKIVLRCIGSGRMAGDAYTAGLLHNIGQIVLATNLSSEYSRVVETSRKLQCPVREAELKLLGVTNNQVGAYLLGLWGMPLSLLESTALYDTPASATSIEFSVLTAVHVANVLAHEDAGSVDGLPLPKLDADYLGTLELPKKTDAWRKFLAPVAQNGSAADVPGERQSGSIVPAQKKRGRTALKLVAVAGLAAMAVAGFVLWRKMAPPPAPPGVTSAVMAKSAAPPAKADVPDNINGPETPAAASPFDSVKIQGVLYSSGRSVALINGKTLDVGELINGLRVVSIEPSKVVLAFNGEQRIFKLK